MTEIITWNLMTLNGFFNGIEDWQLDWHNQVWGDELEQFSIDQLHEIDTLIFGRKTYEGMAVHWVNEEGEVAELMNKVPKIVFSKSLEEASWNNTELIKEDAVDYLKNLLNTNSDKNNKIFIFGSADLLSSLHNAKLIDEYRLCIAPIVLEDGMPLFKQPQFELPMNLKKTKVLESGGIILWLSPKRE